jgi:hypothetical protein
MAQRTLHGAEVDPRFKPMRGIGMPEGMGADVSFADTGALFGFAKSALDAAAGHRGGGAGQVFVIAAGRGLERSLAPLPRCTCIMWRGPSMSPPLKVESFMEAQSTAVEGGEGGALVQGCHGLEEAWDFCAAENGREALFGLSSHDLQDFPGASQDLLGEETASARTDAHGAWREAIDVFSMQQIVLQVLF